MSTAISLVNVNHLTVMIFFSYNENFEDILSGVPIVAQ